MTGGGNYIVARLAVQGAQEFLTTLGRASKGFSEAGKSAVDFARNVAKLTIIGGISALALSAWHAFRSFGSILGNIAQDAFNAAASFQELEIRLEGLLAREARAADASLSVAGAYQVASKEVQRYLDWIKQVAVTTPFEVETLTNVFSLAQAYGFTAKEAQTLTLAIGNFTAGMGLGNEVMQRIIENFGQMRAAGKVTGTELRDLARGAFLPVNDILTRMAENMGIAADQLEEFQKQAKEGGVDVDEFFLAFLQIANEDFPDAMERMSRTWKGVLSNVRDFIKTVLGIELLGPIMDRFGEIAANVLNKLLAPAVRNNARWIGEFLLVAFNRLYDAITQDIVPAIQMLLAAFGINIPTMQDFIGILSLVISTITNAAQRFREWAETVGVDMAGTFANIASNAFSWGVNIVGQLASGLIQGAATAIVSAMNYISGLLAYWLSPGSPPLVAPKIDLWGSAAFKEYLKGFTMTDFDILKSLQGPLKSALDIFVNLGALTPKGAGAAFQSFSEAIAKFLETGSSGGLFANLKSQLGEFGVELGGLLNKQLALLDATKALEAAEEALAAARDNQDKAIENVDALKREYNDLLRAGADPAILEAKLAEINAAEEARDAAIEQTKIEEANVDVAEQRLEPLAEAVKLQEELLRQLIEIQQALLDVKKAGAGAGGGGLPLPEFSGIGLPDIDTSGIEKISGQLQKDWSAIFDRLGQQLRETLGQAWEENFAKPARDAWQNVQDNFANATANIRTSWNNLWTSIQQNPVFQSMSSWVQDRLDATQAAWDEWGTRIENQTSILWENLKTTFSERTADLQDLVSHFLDNVEKFWEEHGGTIRATASELLDFLGWLWDENINWITALVSEFLLDLNLYWMNVKDDVNRFWGEIMDLLKTIMDNGFEVIGAVVDLFAAVLKGDWEGIKTALGEIWQANWDNLKEIFLFFKEDLLGEDGLIMALVDGIVKTFTEYDSWESMGQAVIDGIIAGITSHLPELLALVLDIADQILRILTNRLDIGSPSKVMAELGGYVMEGLNLGLSKGSMEVNHTVEQTAATMTGTMAAVSAPTVMPVTNHNVNLRTGDINTGMDAALLEATVRRIIREEYR